jgi:Protein of unknown function (DUF2878)
MVFARAALSCAARPSGQLRTLPNQLVRCVWGGSSHRPWTGFAIAIILVGVHLALSVERYLEVRLVGLATAVGAVVEMMQIAAGTHRFTSGTVLDALRPPWLLAMWAQLSTTFRYSLRNVITQSPSPGQY